MLSELACKNAKAKDKPYKLSDEKGLYLLIQPSTVEGKKPGKWWRFRYTFQNKENTLSLGTYPEVSLKEARDRRDAFRRDLSAGLSPARSPAISNLFADVCREWLEKKKQECSQAYLAKLDIRLNKYVLPNLAHRSCSDLTAPEVLAVARIAEKAGNLETAHRILNIVGQVLRYAVVTGRIDRNVTADLHRALPPVRVKHFETVLENPDIARLLQDIEDYRGFFPVRQCLRIAPHVFVRSGELRHMKWSQVHFETAEWRFTLSKTHQEHIVPLSRQVLSVLQETQVVSGEGLYVFPGLRAADAGSRPISDMTLVTALRRIGYAKQTVHGFRALARTKLDEDLKFRPELIEHQLGHVVRDPLGRAYNRTTHLGERKKMMQAWSDWLDDLKGFEV